MSFNLQGARDLKTKLPWAAPSGQAWESGCSCPPQSAGKAQALNPGRLPGGGTGRAALGLATGLAAGTEVGKGRRTEDIAGRCRGTRGLGSGG